MTGFGAAEKDGFRVEIRSLNHRFLDIAIKLSPFLSEHEIVLRNLIKERFSRGKFDVAISTINEAKTRLKLNTELAREIYDLLNSLKSDLSIPGTIGIEALLNYKELLVLEEPEYNTTTLHGAFKDAIVQLENMRLEEGKTIAEDIIQRVEKLESVTKDVRALCPEITEILREKYQERVKRLFDGIELDRERILQEVAVILGKADITEELTRIENHLKQFRKILSDGDTIGKRLDFLLQELNREANTIAAKSDDYRISAITVDMKAEIEKIREQAQNIQ